VEDVLSGLVGRRYRVRCVLSSQERSARLTRSPAARPAAVSGDDQSAPPVSRDIIDDPLIRTAVEDLGAQIVR
jgi:hypothetical protein